MNQVNILKSVKTTDELDAIRGRLKSLADTPGVNTITITIDPQNKDSGWHVVASGEKRAGESDHA